MTYEAVMISVNFDTILPREVLCPGWIEGCVPWDVVVCPGCRGGVPWGVAVCPGCRGGVPWDVAVWPGWRGGCVPWGVALCPGWREGWTGHCSRHPNVPAAGVRIFRQVELVSCFLWGPGCERWGCSGGPPGTPRRSGCCPVELPCKIYQIKSVSNVIAK